MTIFQYCRGATRAMAVCGLAAAVLFHGIGDLEAQTQTQSQIADDSALHVDAVDLWLEGQRKSNRSLWGRIFGGAYCNDRSLTMEAAHECGEDESLAMLRRVNLLRRGERDAAVRTHTDDQRQISAFRQNETALQNQLLTSENGMATQQAQLMQMQDQVALLVSRQKALDSTNADLLKSENSLKGEIARLQSELSNTSLAAEQANLALTDELANEKEQLQDYVAYLDAAQIKINELSTEVEVANNEKRAAIDALSSDLKAANDEKHAAISKLSADLETANSEKSAAIEAGQKSAAESKISIASALAANSNCETSMVNQGISHSAKLRSGQALLCSAQSDTAQLQRDLAQRNQDYSALEAAYLALIKEIADRTAGLAGN